MTTINGTSGNDTKTGTSAADTFNMSQGGSDTVNGEGGNDIFSFGAKLDVNDKINGGSGTDVLKLNGGYNLTFSSTTITSVETIELAAGHNYVLRTDNANVASGATLTVYAGTLTSANHLDFDGSAETNGKFVVHGGAGSDELEGGDGADVLYDRVGGTDHLTGNGGADTFNLGAFLTGADHISGGLGSDTLNITGDYTGSHALVLNTSNIDGIQALHLGSGHKYSITTADEGFTTGDTNAFHMTVDGSDLGSADTLSLNATHMVNTNLDVRGGDAADTFNFGAAFDYANTKINGGAGSDTLNLKGDGYNFVTLGSSFLSVEKIVLGAGHDYVLMTTNANVASGATMTVDASGLGSGDNASFDGSAETNGKFILHGGAGNDTLTGGSGADTFYDHHGGNETLDGEGGDDVFNMGATLTGADRIDGWTGNNTVNITGDYTGAAALVMTSDTFHAIDTLHLGAGHNYAITATGDNGANNEILTIDASDLGSANNLSLKVAPLDDTQISALGGAGNDTLNYGSQYGAAKIDGGAGSDTLMLNGDYSGVVYIGTGHLLNVETISLTAGHSYNFDLEQGNLTSSQTLTVDGSTLGASDFLSFANLNSGAGHFILQGGGGNDYLSGGTESDTLNGRGGTDTFYAGGGGDKIDGGGGDDYALYTDGQIFSAADHFDGGSGVDELVLTGDYSAGLTFTSGVISGVEDIFVYGGNSYNLTIDDSAIAAGATLDINAASDQGLTDPSDILTVDARDVVQGKVLVAGGAGNDIVKGGAGNDTIVGYGGADNLDGHGGTDKFFYYGIADSTSATFDTITAFDATADKFDFGFNIGQVDAAVGSGTLSLATFDSDLAAAITSGHMAAGDAVLFTPGAGDFAGDTFLIVDDNGQAGYQSGADFVIELNNGAHLNQLSGANFIKTPIFG